MTIALLTMMLFSILMMAAAITYGQRSHRLKREMDEKQSKLREKEEENENLKSMMRVISQSRGVSESTVLAIAGELTRMEFNLMHMDDVPGRKQLTRAIERIKLTLQTENYVIVPMLGQPYQVGMMANAMFVPDDTLPPGTSIISKVNVTQVNHYGKMIQAANITVSTNAQ